MNGFSSGHVPFPNRREDFPVATLRYLERRLMRLRRLVMSVAAELAAHSSADSDCYRVETVHIDQALSKLFENFSLYENELTCPFGNRA